MITLALVSAMLSGAPTPMTASLSPSSANTIGFYVETTSVSQNTWVPISSDEEDILYIADSCGRQINAWIDSNNVPHLSYLATPEKGKYLAIGRLTTASILSFICSINFTDTLLMIINHLTL